jgi:hypothetical protein
MVDLDVGNAMGTQQSLEISPATADENLVSHFYLRTGKINHRADVPVGL